MKKWFVILLLMAGQQLSAQSMYFPPLLGNNWDTISPASLGWCVNRVDSLYTFLDQQNSKAFIVLKDGKIVLEKYFDNFTRDSIWYWASAGKTLTAFLIGKAQQDGLLSINDTSAKYLGAGWTGATPQQENNIRIRHQLTMTTGLDDGVPDNHCILDSCLQYLAPAGTRWAYHNAPYTLLEKVISTASGQPINTYTQTSLKNKTGITGAWLTIGYDNVYYSKPRSMARFGLLIQNNCIWGNDTLLRDTNYIHDMLNTSQDLNYGYGYLWWLNGKGSYMVPGSQLILPVSYAPAAPVDMYAAIGKNGQIISVVPSKGLVVVRMGEADQGEVPFLLTNSIWEKLNEVICSSTRNRVYTFVGNGNWDVANNWSNNTIPPAVLPAGDQVVIAPLASGECVLNVNQSVPANSSIIVMRNKKLRITGSLVIE